MATARKRRPVSPQAALLTEVKGLRKDITVLARIILQGQRIDQALLKQYARDQTPSTLPTEVLAQILPLSLRDPIFEALREEEPTDGPTLRS